MKRLALIMLFTAAIGITTSVFLHVTAARQTSDSNTVKLKGLRDNVVIRRDDRGIPYIEAKNYEDLFFAQGYATASDRLWQMDLLRRTARGELAEVLGSAALEQDKQHRTLGFAQV